MNQPSALEFVLVSSNYALMQAVSKAVKKCGAKFVLVPTAHEARECLNRRKIDGVFVDMEVPGALGLIESTRKGTSNNKAVIFACLVNAKESTPILAVGMNFLLHKPVTEDGIIMHLTISKDLLVREQRRYFRHPVNLPVTLREGEVEQQARIISARGQVAWVNSEGMAGIMLQTLRGKGSEQLDAWIASREQLDSPIRVSKVAIS
jgi:CheY-like chemotaxis protein